jgi:ADP-heptose:LPS heptosyltransferase
MKVIGFNAGQYGDLVACLAAVQGFKEVYPETKFTFAIGNKYGDCEPCFQNQPLIHSTHVWKSYDDWPVQADWDYIVTQKFDRVFDAMPKHHTSDWYYEKNLTEKMCLMNGVNIPQNIDISLHQWFPSITEFKDYVAISLVSSSTRKNISFQKSQELVNDLNKLGVKVLQLGLLTDRPFHNATQFYGNYFQAVQAMVSCKGLLTLDTGMSWFAAAYKRPVVGLYNYLDSSTTKTFEPPNVNAQYLSAKNCEDINNDTIIEAIKTIL